jgi:hypothetical protein
LPATTAASLGVGRIDQYWADVEARDVFRRDGRDHHDGYQAALVLPYDGQLGTVPADATTEDRARSYLHANCAYCHRPDGDFAAMDLRFDTPLAKMGACGVAPMKSDLGVTGALVLTQGAPTMLIMWLRMRSPRIDEKTRMPQLATYVVDDTAVGLVGDWITSIATCP